MKLLALPGIAAAWAYLPVEVTLLLALLVVTIATFGTLGCFHNLRGGGTDRDQSVPHTEGHGG